MEGCTHRDHQDEAACRKLCDPGHTLCPYHELLRDAAEVAKEDRRTRPQGRRNGRAAARRLREEKMR